MTTKRSEQKENKEPTVRQTRFDRFSTILRRCRGYRLLIAPLLAAALYFTAKTLHGDKDAVQLKFVETPSEQIGVSGASSTDAVRPVFSGEAYDSAMRLRESGALLMAVSLSAFDEFRVSGRFPANVGEVLTGLQKRILLPSGIEVSQGVLRSSLSEIFLNYRTDPFSFEILSFPLDSGPILLFRFPLPSVEANSIGYFQSSAGSPVGGPAPFSSADQLVATGWRIARWRGDVLPLDGVTLRDLREQDEWLKAQTQGR